MNITAIFLPIYVIVKALVTYPTGDIDIYIDAYRQNDTINDEINDDDITLKINNDYFK
tara:strand:+ start:118 stop:291 length:174 start_codon:yes stop_codon:yes gene_type:complete